MIFVTIITQPINIFSNLLYVYLCLNSFAIILDYQGDDSSC